MSKPHTGTKAYVATFNEPGDFDTYGLFLDTPEGQRLIAYSAKCPWEYPGGPASVTDWKRPKKRIVYTGHRDAYAYIHDKVPVLTNVLGLLKPYLKA